MSADPVPHPGESERNRSAPIYEALNEPAKSGRRELVKQSTMPRFHVLRAKATASVRESAITRFKVLGRMQSRPALGDQGDSKSRATDLSSVAKRRALPVLPSSVIQPTRKSFKIMSIDIHIVKRWA